MINLMHQAGLRLDDGCNTEAGITVYGMAVLKAMAACPVLPGAEELIRRARQARLLCISSNTPEDALRELVDSRGWPLVDFVYGYPRRKQDTVSRIVTLCGGHSDKVLVIGDGVSDKEAARDNGCVFVSVNGCSGFAPAFAALEAIIVQG